MYFKPAYLDGAGRKKKPYWVARVVIDGRRRSFYLKTQDDAWKKLIELKESRLPNRGKMSGRQAVDQYLSSWLDVTKDSLRPKTLKSYRQIVQRFLAPALKDIPLRHLSTEHVQVLVNQAKARVSPRTVQYIRAILRAALNYAVLQRYIERNPAQGRLVSLPQPRRQVPQLWNQREVERFLGAIRGERLQPLYLVALKQGLRQGEILALQWSDIDFGRGTLSVRRQLQELDGKFQFVEPKTQASRRTIPLHREVRAALLRLRGRWRPAPVPWHELVFVSTAATPIGPRNLVRSFKETIKRAGLPDIRFHDLRRLFCSELAVRGVPPRVAMSVMGHTNIATTFEIYASVGAEDAAQALARAWRHG